MRAAEVAESRCSRQVRDADVNFGMDALVIGIGDENDRESNFVKDGEHFARAKNEEVSDDSISVSQM